HLAAAEVMRQAWALERGQGRVDPGILLWHADFVEALVGAGARAEAAEAVFAGLPEDEFPEMRGLASQVAEPTTDRHFHAGLRWLLQGISAAPREG
ncbi:MAG TPA: hypothetical protein VLA80_09435, partial [Actinomycetota bacterium]|nr:hypothetical protein [Actinomycetota bacterium]